MNKDIFFTHTAFNYILERGKIMLIKGCRTDLAIEALELSKEDNISEISGVISKTENLSGFSVTKVEITNQQAAEQIGKPIGIYDTIVIDALARRENDAFSRACNALSECIKKLLPENDNAPALVIGLGNRQITPDAIGPFACEYILATRHLIGKEPELFNNWRSVSVLSSGVLGQTGIEVQELAKGIIEQIKPCVVIAIDALAAGDADRLCRTIQLSNTGIVPGSGVQNSRSALNDKTLGVPVIAIGAPTVIDACVLLSENTKTPLFVTTRDIDKDVNDISRVIGYSLNMAFQPDLTPETIDLYLS